MRPESQPDPSRRVRYASPSADCLASYAGTAPIEASSGDVVRHRLSRHGNRQLNNAIHLAAHTQTIRPGPGRDYYQRRRDTGNSRNEALRLLKRQLTKTIYRTLLADADRTRQNAVSFPPNRGGLVRRRWLVRILLG